MINSIDPFKTHFSLLSGAVDSTFSESLLEAHRLYAKNPIIEACILADQETHAKGKKVIRLADKAWLQRNQLALSCLEQEADAGSPKEIALAEGCPRMPEFMVFACIYIRGLFGGIKSKQTQCLLRESLTFRNICDNLDIKLPGASTIIDNLNIISQETLHLIHKAQILYALDESLDTFDEVAFDSTSVKGNVSWPTESNLLYLLVKRIYHMGSQLDQWGVISMQERNFPKIIKDLNKLSTRIALESGKPNCITKRKADYNSMLGKATSTKGKFEKEMVKIMASVEKTDMQPSRKKKLLAIIEMIEGDIMNLQKVIDSSTRRIMSLGSGFHNLIIT